MKFGESLKVYLMNYPLFIKVFAYERDDAIEKMEIYIGEKFKDSEDRQPEEFKKMFAEFDLNDLQEFEGDINEY